MHVEDAARVLIAVAKKRWSGVSAVADDYPANWNEFFTVIKEYYTGFRNIRVPKWLLHIGLWGLKPFLSIRSTPSLLTSDTIKGFNLNLPVKPRLLWTELDIAPKYPTIRQGITAVLDDFVAFRWRLL